MVNESVFIATGEMRSSLSSSATSLGDCVGAYIGALDGVLAVYHAYDPAKGARPAVHRVWTILRGRDAALREALAAREAAAAAKFPELRFEFDVTDRADPPALGAKLVYAAK